MVSALDHSVQLGESIRRMSVRRLTTDNPGYQRVLSARWVAYLVADWDPDAVGVLIVNERPDGSYQLVDGQHRLAAMIELGIETCVVQVAKKQREEEARLWLRVNKNLAVSALERYRALLDAGDYEAHDLKRVVEAAQFFITTTVRRKRGGHGGPRELTAIAELYMAYRGGVLEETLGMVKACWPHDPEASAGYVIGGVSVVLRWVRSNRFPFQKSSAVQRWGEQTIREIVGLARREAQASRKRTVGRDRDSFSDALVELYNYKRQSQNLLPFSFERNSAARMMRRGQPAIG